MADLAALVPGTNQLTVQAPGWHTLTIEVDAGPVFSSEQDIASLAGLRMQTVPLVHAIRLGSGAVAPEYTLHLIGGLTSSVSAETSIQLGGGARRVANLAAGVQARCLYVVYRGGSGAASVLCPDGEVFHAKLKSTDEGRWTVAQIDLGHLRRVETIVVSVEGSSRIELGAITALGAVRANAGAGIPASLRALLAGETITLFAFDTPSLAGWKLAGNAWGVTDTVGEPFARKGGSRYFADSKAQGGETATGTAVSPEFTLSGSRLRFLANGHGAANYFALVSADSSKELIRAHVPEKTGPFVPILWDVSAFRGQRVRFKAVDEETKTGFAWIAFDEIAVLP